MKKNIISLIVLIFILTVSGCTRKPEVAQFDPIEGREQMEEVIKLEADLEDVAGFEETLPEEPPELEGVLFEEALEEPSPLPPEEPLELEEVIVEEDVEEFLLEE